MANVIKGTQKLYLWSLLGNGGEGFMCEQAVDLKASERKALIDQGLVASNSRKRPLSGRAATYYTLTDKGWDWAANAMQEPIDSRSTKGGEVLSSMLRRLDTFLKLKGFGLADVLVPVSPESHPETETLVSEIAKLRESLLRLGGGERGQRIRLAQLRAQLPDVPADRINQALAAMQGKGELLLYPMDDPQERTAEDEAAAIDIAGVGKRHLVILED